MARPGLLGLQDFHGIPKSRLSLSHREVIVIRLAGPEEAFQAVPMTAWNDMDVKMRDTLADTVVDGHECPIGVKRLFGRSGQQLGAPK